MAEEDLSGLEDRYEKITGNASQRDTATEDMRGQITLT